MNRDEGIAALMQSWMDAVDGCLPKKARAGAKKWMLNVTSRIWQNSMLIGDFFFIFTHTHLGQRIHLLETNFLGGKPYFLHIINVKTYVYLVGHKTNMTIRM